MKLSLAIITYNEEDNLARTLEAAAGIADEIVIMDSGSTDQTVAIAKSYGAEIITQPWLGFSKQKNLLFTYCKSEWILSLDADEVLTPQLKINILQAIAHSPSQTAGYILQRHTVYMNKELNHAFCDQKLRLVQRALQPYWEGELVHEKLLINGPVKLLSGRLLHYSYRDFSDHFNRSIHYARLGATQKTAQKKTSSMFKILFNPPAAFFKSYILKAGFLDGMPGFIVSMMRALDVWMKYLFLFEQSNRGSLKKKK